MLNIGLAATHPTVCDHTIQGVLVVKICRYLRAAAIRHTAVVRAFRAHSANNTFWKKKKDTITSVTIEQTELFYVLSIFKTNRKKTTNSWWIKTEMCTASLFAILQTGTPYMVQKRVRNTKRTHWNQSALFYSRNYSDSIPQLPTAALFSFSSLNPSSRLKAAGQMCR